MSYFSVNIGELVRAANDLNELNESLKNRINNLIDQEAALNNMWEAEDAAYINKLNGLQGDLDQMYRMIREHSADPEEMAASYMGPETQNESGAIALTNDVIH